MRVRFNVAEVVGVVEKTLSSIDIRTASVLIDKGAGRTIIGVVAGYLTNAILVARRLVFWPFKVLASNSHVSCARAPWQTENETRRIHFF
jgi:hypothetical protein